MMRVFLYGRSLLIRGLEESLQALPGLESVRLGSAGDGLLEQVRRFQPKAVVAEDGALPDSLSMALLREIPGLALVTLDLEFNRAQVVSGHQAEAITAKDLVQIIETKIAVDAAKEVSLSEKKGNA